MKNKTWKFALICSLIVMGFTASDDDDEYYYVGGGSSWLSYGNLEKIDNESRSKFAIRRDDGNRLIVTEGMPINFDGAEENLRVYVNYSIVGSERDEVRVGEMYELLHSSLNLMTFDRKECR